MLGHRGGMLGRDPHRDQGTVAIVVAIMVVVLFGLVAIVVDLGQARDVRRQAQLAADSAALAAAHVLSEAPDPDDDTTQASAVSAAGKYAHNNLGVPQSDWDACTTCVTIDPAGKQVTVRLPADSPVSFAGIYGVDSVTVSASATASWGADLPGDCLLCVTGDATVDRVVGGDVTVNDGDVRVGGALDVQFPHTLDVNAGNAFYGSSVGTTPTVDPGYRNEAGLTGFTDPYAGSAVHDPWSVLPSLDSGDIANPDGAGRCRPHSGGSVGFLYAPDAGACRSFAPGIYLIIPRPHANPLFDPGAYEIRLGSAGAVTGSSDVLLLPTCSDGTSGLPVACSGSHTDGAYLQRPGSDVTLSGVTDATGLLAPFQGFSIIVDPGNTSTGQQLGSSSGADLDITGSVYAPGQHLTVNDRTRITGQLIAGTDLTVGSGWFSCAGACLTLDAPTTVLPPPDSAPVRLVSGN